MNFLRNLVFNCLQSSLPAADPNRLSEMKLPSRQTSGSIANFSSSQYSLDDLVDEIRNLKDKHSRLEALVLEVPTAMLLLKCPDIAPEGPREFREERGRA